jgi:hypothetical protein
MTVREKVPAQAAPARPYLFAEQRFPRAAPRRFRPALCRKQTIIPRRYARQAFSGVVINSHKSVLHFAAAFFTDAALHNQFAAQHPFARARADGGRNRHFSFA